ncbi:MAG: alpha-ketoacid dehydrogenase subunit beta [Candidatus Humimicrobiaceae bacterium]
MRKMRYLHAVAEAVLLEMRRDQDIFYMGEDVRQPVRGITKGFLEEFGENRIIDTPISESGFVGIATGAAIEGMRPILEFQINEFVFFAFDALVDQAQKIYYMSGGKKKVPLTCIVAGTGARGSTAGQHSDNPYPYVLHAGMKSILPSSPYDAKGLVASAIRDNDPVMVFLPLQILGVKGDVPEEEYTIPLGKGEIKKEGTDVTVVATGHLVNKAIEVANKLEAEGISVEVYDPRTLLPLDKNLLYKTVRKTGRVVIIDDSNRTCGFAAEVAALIADECFSILKSPIKRVTRADVTVPFSPALEKCVLPGEEQLVDAIHKVIQ